MTLDRVRRSLRRLAGRVMDDPGEAGDNERTARGLLTGFFSDPPPEHDPHRRRDPGQPRF
ncbi:MAG: hypothetical protein KY457_09175 [Actinobacteria bacterium]|nr:hypothetical protein [Actinomycetota bacterium]